MTWLNISVLGQLDMEPEVIQNNLFYENIFYFNPIGIKKQIFLNS